MAGTQRVEDPIRVVGVREAGAEPHDDTVTLDHDHRSRRRHVFRTEGGTAILLDLARRRTLADGMALLLADGRVVAVRAAPEPLLEIRASSADRLARLAWHIGNRHVPAEFRGDVIRIRADHVLEAMLAGLGAEVVPVSAPFEPEQGAYAGHHDAFHTHHGHHGHHGDSGPGADADHD